MKKLRAKNRALEAKKVASDINPKEFLDQEAFVRQSTSWLRENGILTEYDMDAMILNTYVVSNKVKHVNMSIDKPKKHVTLDVFVGRMTYLFSNKEKLIDLILEQTKTIVQDNYTVSINIKLFRKSLI